MYVSSAALRKTAAFVAGFFVCLFFVVIYLFIFGDLHLTDLGKNSCSKTYPFTNSSLDCAEYNDNAVRLNALDAKLEAATRQYVHEGKAKRVSVWTRDLVTGQWASSDEFDTYAPASLLKVPLMIAYYKFAQIEPSILDQKLVYTPAATQGDSIQDILPATLLVTGQQYSTEQLIEAMIEQSDNNAADILGQKIDAQFFDGVLLDLGIRIPDKAKEYDFLTAKTYANIFRQLYNATYLNRDYSEKALELLSAADFNGIRAPLPVGTKVANKFGEREMVNPDGSIQTRELHDCGIVYKNPHPYVLCVFTEGSDFGTLKTVIGEISKTVYDGI